MANTTSRLLNTDSLVQWSQKVNQLADRVDALSSASGSITGTFSTNKITVYDGANWSPFTVANDLSLSLSSPNANFTLTATAITGKTAVTSTDFDNDYILIYNASAGALRKIKPKYTSFPAGTTNQVQFHGGATGFAGAAGFTYNSDNGVLNVDNITVGSTGFSVNSKYVSLGGNFNTSGAYAITLGASGPTSVNLPTGGTLLSTSTTSLPSVTSAANLTSIGTLSSLTVSGGVILGGGSLTVNSTSPTFSSAVTFNNTITGTNATFSGTFNTGTSAVGFGGNVGVGGTLGATGAVTFGSTLNVTGTSTLTNIGATGVIAFRHVFTNGGLNVGATGAGVGEIRATGDITAYYSSDARFKDNVVEIPDALEKIKSIRGVTFDWNEEYIKSHGGEDGYFVRKRDVGVIAQEIQRVLPELVVERSEGYLAVKYDRIVALLIQAVKELSDKLEERK